MPVGWDAANALGVVAYAGVAYRDAQSLARALTADDGCARVALARARGPIGECVLVVAWGGTDALLVVGVRDGGGWALVAFDGKSDPVVRRADAELVASEVVNKAVAEIKLDTDYEVFISNRPQNEARLIQEVNERGGNWRVEEVTRGSVIVFLVAETDTAEEAAALATSVETALTGSVTLSGYKVLAVEARPVRVAAAKAPDTPPQLAATNASNVPPQPQPSLPESMAALRAQVAVAVAGFVVDRTQSVIAAMRVSAPEVDANASRVLVEQVDGVARNAIAAVVAQADACVQAGVARGGACG